MATETPCNACGCNPCVSICPEVDPYAGNQAAEEADYSFGARYDRWDSYREPDPEMDRSYTWATPTTVHVIFRGDASLADVTGYLAEGEHELGDLATSVAYSLDGLWPENDCPWGRIAVVPEYANEPKVNVGGIAMTLSETAAYLNAPDKTKVPLPISPDEIPF